MHTGGGRIKELKVWQVLLVLPATVTCQSYPQKPNEPNEQSLWVITEPYKPVHQHHHSQTLCVCEREREGLVQTPSRLLAV